MIWDYSGDTRSSISQGQGGQVRLKTYDTITYPISSSSYENQELQNIAEIDSENGFKRTPVTEKIEEVDTAKLNRMVWKGGTYFLSTTLKKPKK